MFDSADFFSRPAVIRSPPRERRQEVRSSIYTSFVYGQVARKSSRPKFLVKSPEMLSYMARNFIKLNNILASLFHIYRTCFVSLKIKERVILLIALVSLFIKGLLSRARYITHNGWLYTACFAPLSLKERGMLHIHSACFVSC